MKIKAKEVTEGCKFGYIKKGEWIDLKAAEDIELKAPQAGILKRKTVNGEEVSHRDVTFDFKLIPLGIRVHLPDGYEADIAPRSGTFKNYGILQPNSPGVIDSTFRGEEDEWKFPALATRDTVIHKGERICQFRVHLSQKATMWQKIKWLFSNKFEFEWVDELKGENRGGFSSTGVK